MCDPRRLLGGRSARARRGFRARPRRAPDREGPPGAAMTARGWDGTGNDGQPRTTKGQRRPRGAHERSQGRGGERYGGGWASPMRREHTKAIKRTIVGGAPTGGFRSRSDQQHV
eukprot:409430-Pyramimonas_sp.AAC.1